MCFSMLSGDLGLVVDQFGEPDGYTVFYNDPGAYEVQVFYPNYGLVLIGYMRTTEMISQDTFVDTFYILSPEDPEYFYDSYIDNINKLYKEDPGSNEWPIYYEWEGFGVYPKDKFP